MRLNAKTTPYEKDLAATPQTRKHIILMDGTWNDETGLNANMLVTNIVNLKRILVDDGETQIVRYHRGVGNDNDNSWLSQSWKGLSGKDVHRIVDNAYARMVQDWQAGDRICIFGFSRGAAAARLLASKIHKEGIPKKITITLTAKENKETKVVEQELSEYTMERAEPHHPQEVEFLGVWDTVSAFGVGNNLMRFIFNKTEDLFSDNHIAANIQKAVHLVAIDETRKPFVPSLMNKKKDDVVHEVWFPGVHSDIGGSYQEDEIAKASLHYMIQEWKKWNEHRGLSPMKMNEEALQSMTTCKPEKAHFHFHGLGTGEQLRQIGVQENGELKAAKVDRPKIHELYYDIAKSKNSYSVVELKSDGDSNKTAAINFQYMPFNVKVLDGNFDVVKNEP